MSTPGGMTESAAVAESVSTRVLFECEEAFVYQIPAKSWTAGGMRAATWGLANVRTIDSHLFTQNVSLSALALTKLLDSMLILLAGFQELQYRVEILMSHALFMFMCIAASNAHFAARGRQRFHPNPTATPRHREDRCGVCI